MHYSILLIHKNDSIYVHLLRKEVQSQQDMNCSVGIVNCPERANYFENPELLLFDWHYKIDIRHPYILEDKENQKRIQKRLLRANIINNFDWAINKMKKRVSANDDISDMVLVVTKIGNIYRVTYLTLDMAYNKARLIARPEIT